MTVIDTLPAVDVSVSLSTSFRNADEYPDPNTYHQERYLGGFERCARNYIESQSGAEFCIHVNAKDFGQGAWRFTFSSRRHPNENRSALVENRFKFQSIVTVDDEPTDGDFRRARDLGTVEVKVKLGKISGILDRQQNKNLERDFNEPDLDYFQIPEEALKGRPIFHGTSFTPTRELRGDPPRRNILKTSTGPLLATYTFKYRSREALKIENIIPRTPSPEPWSRTRSVHFEELGGLRFEDLYDDEVERLARERLRQLRNERLQRSCLKKRTYDDYCDLTQDDDEQPMRPYKIIKLSSHDIIDLTGGS